MRFEWLEAFQLTAETQSLTKASELLHMSQPALSKQIKNLENDLGASLFKRTTVGVSLTQAGERLLPVSQRILKELNTVKKAIALEQGLMGVTIGAWPSVATSYLPTKLASANRSDYSLKISHSYVELLEGLNEGKIDVALFDETGIQHSYFSTPVFSESFLLFAHKDHLLFGSRESVTFKEIKDEEFVMLLETCDARRLIQDAFVERNATLNIQAEIEFGHSILGFIEANIGISILPEIFTKGISPNVRAIPIEGFPIKRTVSLIAREESVGKKVLAMLK
ncbi:LysR family transcriptional regulator [Mangrovibacillus cuniculi]|uniref:LysR family transcriptional regulator n=1 Tax=Mangrovibacillus cuniculi TaxID=2593652 RepID=A0A7S8C914_9BACI|nr:LysR family transcriptional regulator [Mangrovibacillus cuniculi]QPC45655.1 LysR family transcriptional regulator [Mangrovibacillus cuniculi]